MLALARRDKLYILLLLFIDFPFQSDHMAVLNRFGMREKEGRKRSLVFKCVASPKSLCPDLLNDSDSMFTQCLMHHAVRPWRE